MMLLLTRNFEKGAFQMRLTTTRVWWKNAMEKKKKIHFQFDHEHNTHKVCFIALTWLTKSAITDKIREWTTWRTTAVLLHGS